MLNGLNGRLGFGLLLLGFLVAPGAALRGGDVPQAPPPPRSAIPQQKATMASMKAIAAAWETYFNDFSTYCPPQKTAPEPQWGNLTPEELRGFLVPTYIERLPLGTDGAAPCSSACDAPRLDLDRTASAP